MTTRFKIYSLFGEWARQSQSALSPAFEVGIQLQPKQDKQERNTFVSLLKKGLSEHFMLF